MDELLEIREPESLTISIDNGWRRHTFLNPALWGKAREIESRAYRRGWWGWTLWLQGLLCSIVSFLCMMYLLGTSDWLNALSEGWQVVIGFAAPLIYGVVVLKIGRAHV